MLSVKRQQTPARKDDRVILHFDYDCFYASVFEAENPDLKRLPLAVQQKQIIVTCNYEARRRGLRKLQLIKDAKRICPDVVIVLGEDISRFRDASKRLYRFLCSHSWSGRAERLGFDEVWLDVTDMIDYNASLLNLNDIANSFFVLAKDDPTKGFAFDATCYAGHVYPESENPRPASTNEETMSLRLRLGSHLALYIRSELEKQTGYTSTVGVSTCKLLAKLVGNLHKPKDQTTLVPPYAAQGDCKSNVQIFMDSFEVGKIPGIGFKLARKLREAVLHHEPDFDKGLVYGATREHVTVSDVRSFPGMDSEKLEKLLGGPGSPYGIGVKTWSLLHGVDDTEVGFARSVPKQISIEDSYIRLDTLPEVLKELNMLSCSLLSRMRIDLIADGDDDFDVIVKSPALGKEEKPSHQWLAHPRTIRLSTRPRLPPNSDGTRPRTFKRTSHSAPLPNFVFSLTESIDALAEQLVQDTLIVMFRKLHPEKAGWDLSLINVAVTNMAEAGGDSKHANGRDIGNMFRRQKSALNEFRVYDNTQISRQHSPPSDPKTGTMAVAEQVVTMPCSSDVAEENCWTNDDGDDVGERCGICGIVLPLFAMPAHERYHQLGE